jgi:hypothetical protein
VCERDAERVDLLLAHHRAVRTDALGDSNDRVVDRAVLVVFEPECQRLALAGNERRRIAVGDELAAVGLGEEVRLGVGRLLWRRGGDEGDRSDQQQNGDRKRSGLAGRPQRCDQRRPETGVDTAL